MNLKINHLQYVGIPVTDISRSEVFYEKLGFQNVMNTSFDHKGDKGKVAMMKQNDIIIELYQMPEAILNEIRERKNGHIDHIAFDVDNIEETFEAVKASGFEVIEEKPVFLSFWKKGCKYFNITGPDGERLEFNQIL